MVTNVTWTWPDLDLDPSLVSNINSNSFFPYSLEVFGESLGPKLLILISLWLVTWNTRFWHLTWPWPCMWSHFENLGGALRPPHWKLLNATSLSRGVEQWSGVKFWSGAMYKELEFRSTHPGECGNGHARVGWFFKCKERTHPQSGDFQSQKSSSRT